MKQIAAMNKKLDGWGSRNFDRNPLHLCLGFFFTSHELPYTIEVEDLLQEGIDPTGPVTDKGDAKSAELLQRLLAPRKLCIVVDEAEGLVRVTTAKAALAKKWKIHLLKGGGAF